VTRSKTDDEVLALGRASRIIEGLEDPRAQARVASYLFYRFTAAGESILPAEERRAIRAIESLEVHDQPAALPAAQAPQAASPVGGATPPATVNGTTLPGGAETGNTGTAARAETGTAGTPATAPADPVPGWNLSAEGSEKDDVEIPGAAEQAAARKAPPKARMRRETPPSAPTKVTEVDGGWDISPDAEIEVKI
jgi:hypothetical protein